MEKKLDDRVLLLAWHLFDISRDCDYTADEFQSAIAFLYGWSCHDRSEDFKKMMLVLAEIGMERTDA